MHRAGAPQHGGVIPRSTVYDYNTKGGENNPVFRFRTAGGPSTIEEAHRLQSRQRERGGQASARNDTGDQDMIYRGCCGVGREGSEVVWGLPSTIERRYRYGRGESMKHQGTGFAKHRAHTEAEVR